jgi:nitrite reductase/ring-hydroxylating ferredoxin subunit
MDTDNSEAGAEFVRVGRLEEVAARHMTVVSGAHPPILVSSDGARCFAVDNRCPHLGFPLHRGTVEDGILTCHWHHARFDVASGGGFDLWADCHAAAVTETGPYWPGARFPMTVTTVLLFDEQRDTLIAAATSAREQVTACAESLRLMPALQAEYRNRAAALCNALAALEVNARAGNLAAELSDLQEQHARLQRQLDEEKARADALAAALRNALERLGAAASPADVEAARALVSHA